MAPKVFGFQCWQKRLEFAYVHQPTFGRDFIDYYIPLLVRDLRIHDAEDSNDHSHSLLRYLAVDFALRLPCEPGPDGVLRPDALERVFEHLIPERSRVAFTSRTSAYGRQSALLTLAQHLLAAALDIRPLPSPFYPDQLPKIRFLKENGCRLCEWDSTGEHQQTVWECLRGLSSVPGVGSVEECLGLLLSEHIPESLVVPLRPPQGVLAPRSIRLAEMWYAYDKRWPTFDLRHNRHSALAVVLAEGRLDVAEYLMQRAAPLTVTESAPPSTLSDEALALLKRPHWPSTYGALEASLHMRRPLARVVRTLLLLRCDASHVMFLLSTELLFEIIHLVPIDYSRQVEGRRLVDLSVCG